MSLKEKFNEIMESARHFRIAASEPEEVPDPEDILANTLSLWACNTACTEDFLPWLKDRIELHNKMEMESMTHHPLMTFHKGRKEEAAYILSQFKRWIETNRSELPSVLE